MGGSSHLRAEGTISTVADGGPPGATAEAPITSLADHAGVGSRALPGLVDSFGSDYDVMQGEVLRGSRGFEWVKGQQLGRGAFGSVYVGMNKQTGSFFAAKQVSIMEPTSESGLKAQSVLQNEIRLLRRIRHPHIVSYLGCERTDPQTFTVFMEYVPGGDIAGVLARFGPFANSVIANYTPQLLEGLQYLHANEIVHRGGWSGAACPSRLHPRLASRTTATCSSTTATSIYLPQLEYFPLLPEHSL